MKKKTLALLLVAGISLFSGTAFAAGWNVNSRGQQVYQNDDGSVVQNSWIKINQNGQSLWYYATGDGSLKQDGWLKLQEASTTLTETALCRPAGWMMTITTATPAVER